jgi:hypothetical protein
MSEQSSGGTEQFISHPNTRTLHRGSRSDGAECGQPSDSWATVDAENPLDAVLNYGCPPCSKCFSRGYHDLSRIYYKEHTAVLCRYSVEEVIESSIWPIDADTDRSAEGQR